MVTRQECLAMALRAATGPEHAGKSPRTEAMMLLETARRMLDQLDEDGAARDPVLLPHLCANVAAHAALLCEKSTAAALARPMMRENG